MKIQLDEHDDRLAALEALDRAKAIGRFVSEAVTRENREAVSLGESAQFGLQTIMELQAALIDAAVPLLEQSAKLRAVS